MTIKNITYYIQGRLCERQALKLWEQLLSNEEDLAMLDFYLLLKQFYSEEFSKLA